MQIQQALEVGKQAHVNGDRLTARGYYRLVLEQDPHHVEARHLIGVLELQEGRHAQAAELLQAVVSDDPGVPKYRLNLALAFIACEQPDLAVPLLRQLLTEMPGHPQVLGNLARIAFDRQEWSEAATLFEAAFQSARRVAEFPMNLAVCRAKMGDTDGARAALKMAFHVAPSMREVAKNLEHAYSEAPIAERAALWETASQDYPQSAGAWLALAQVRVQQKRFDDAVACFQRATVRDENWSEPFIAAGRLLHSLNRVEEARTMANRAVLLDDENADALVLLAKVAQEQRSSDATDWALDRLLTLHPDNTSAISARASQLASRGDMQGVVALFEGREMTPDLSIIYDLAIATTYEKTDVSKARDALRPMMEQRPDHEGAVRLFSSLADTPELYAEAAQRLEAQPDRPGHSGAFRLFELARLNDKLKRHDVAWDWVCQGNARHLNPYRSRFEVRVLDRVKEVFSQPIPRQDDGARPIFVVGMPRSGTTLTESILDRHPQLIGVGESEGAGRAIGAVEQTLAGDIQWPESTRQLDGAQLRLFREAYQYVLNESVDVPPGLRTVDKMPGNYRRVGVLAKAFPGAKFVWCRRDWRDNLVSLFFGNFGGNHPYAYALDDIRTEYAIHNAYMAHWASLGIPIHEHHYTRVIEDFEGAVTDLQAFVDVPFDEDCLNFHQTKRVVNTMSFRQVRKPLYRSSLDRWKRYEAQLTAHFGLDVLNEEPVL